MHENIFRAIDWARNQSFSLNAVTLRLMDGRLVEYYPVLDEPTAPWYPDCCWAWL